ncbi:hypothetical protein BMNI_II0344 [Brucella melitensis NI]|nr:hypothetical protein BMNI_II0344 [Brucella melitensis NI]EXU84999.1 hypothetical protein AX23_00500 [Brucella melitensis 548]
MSAAVLNRFFIKITLSKAAAEQPKKANRIPVSNNHVYFLYLLIKEVKS